MKALLAFVAGLLLAASLGASRPMMTCPEDAVAVGYGDYSGGYWSAYECIALDDLGVNHTAFTLGAFSARYIPR